MRSQLLLLVGIVGVASLGALVGCDGTTTSSEAVDPAAVSAPAEPTGVFVTADSSSASFAPPASGALAACDGEGSGDACSFESRWGDTIAGTCRLRPDGSGELRCRPDERPERGEGWPERREQALTACAGIDVGATCGLTGPEGESVTGTCVAGPDDSGEAVCRPDDWLNGGERRERRRELALNACDGSSSGATCSFETPVGTISGTCQTPPSTDALACRPAAPPQP